MYKSFIFIISFLFFTNSLASYVIYHDGRQSIGSVPFSSGFYFSGGGGSMSVTETHYVPVIYNQYPDAVWVPAAQGRLPVNAIIYQYINGRPVFYCRIQDDYRIEYGQLVPDEGCFLFSEPQGEPYTSYQVLVR